MAVPEVALSLLEVPGRSDDKQDLLPSAEPRPNPCQSNLQSFLGCPHASGFHPASVSKMLHDLTLTGIRRFHDMTFSAVLTPARASFS